MDAASWDRRYAETELVWSAQPNIFVEQVCTELAPGRAVDIACGEGRNAIWLAGLGWEVWGVDFSAVALDKARQIAERTGAEVHWVHGTAQQLAIQLEPPMDLALFCYLQVPHDEFAEALRAGIEVLAPGGHLVVIAHALRNLDEGFGGPQDPAVLPTPEGVAALLDSAGLTVTRAEHVDRVVTTPDGPRTAIDLVVVATAAPQAP